MRIALILFVGLLLLGVWLGNCDGESRVDHGDSRKSPTSDKIPWVRTVDGWERATWLEPKTGYRPGLHPFVVALFVVLSATTGLLAFSPLFDPRSDEDLTNR